MAAPCSSVVLLACLLSLARAAVPDSAQAAAGSPSLLASTLHFSARPDRTYCLLSDPCVHVNALFVSAPGAGQGAARTRLVQGVGIRAGEHTLILRTAPEAHAPQTGRRSPLALVMLDYADVLGALAEGGSAGSEDGAVRVEAQEAGQALLVTLRDCSLRLLLRLHSLALGQGVSSPHVSVHALDWQNLDHPHGLLGQALPNRALRAHFSSPSSSSPSAARSKLPMGMSVQSALKQLQSLAQQPSALVGVPIDYLTSGLLEPNCHFSRFTRPRAAFHTERLTFGNEEAHEEEDEEAEARPSLHTLEHIARSTGASVEEYRNPETQTLRRLDTLRGSSSAGRTAVLSSPDLRLLADMQGTQDGAVEEEETLPGDHEEREDSDNEVVSRQGLKQSSSSDDVEEDARSDVSARASKRGVKLTRADLDQISSTHGTQEDYSDVEDASVAAAEAQGSKTSQGRAQEDHAVPKKKKKGPRASAEDLKLIESMQGTLE